MTLATIEVPSGPEILRALMGQAGTGSPLGLQSSTRLILFGLLCLSVVTLQTGLMDLVFRMRETGTRSHVLVIALLGRPAFDWSSVTANSKSPL
jgi:hypothetical protein